MVALVCLLFLLPACSKSEQQPDSTVADLGPVGGETGPAKPDTTAPKPDTVDPVKAFCDKYGAPGCCDDAASKVRWCENGVIKEGDCTSGCGWDAANNLYDCGSSGADPSGKYPRACPGVTPCQPKCTAGTCGMDNGCGQPCGCGSGYVCQAGSCVPGQPSCTTGQKRCTGNDVEVCSSGAWTKQTTCANGCAAGVCIGGDCSGCPLSASTLKVTFPWVSTSPPTVVKVAGSCYVGTNPKPCGHKSASYLKILKYTGPSVVSITDTAGILYAINFPLGQSAASSTQLSSLASATGLPVAELQKSLADETLAISDPPKLIGYTLPAGVTASAFLPTSSTSPGVVKFESTNKTALATVLNTLGGAGITADLTVKLFMGFGTYTYRCQLRTTGLTITGITL